MKRSSVIMLAVALFTLGCQKKADPNSGANAEQTAGKEEKPCTPGSDWLPTTTLPTASRIEDSEPDCTFYQAAYQQFLYVTATSAGSPAFLAKPYLTVADLFGGSATPLVPTQRPRLLSLTPRTPEQPHSAALLDSTALGSGIRQAGKLQGLLVDRNGHPIFYSIHVNDKFANFVRDGKHRATTAPELAAFDKDIPFSGDIVELKAAWMIVDGSMSASDYITTQAIVPHLKQDKSSNISLDATVKSDPVTVALIALHVAFTRPNHPEMIWASFEHVDKNGEPDLAPNAKANPVAGATVELVAPDRSYLLFAKGSTAAMANNGRAKLTLNEALQTFDGSTPIYRVYPHSKVGTGSDEEDFAVRTLNENVRAELEKSKPVTDLRYHYRLVGAVWLKHPEKLKDVPNSGFETGSAFANGDDQSSDDPIARLSGEGAMSSMAMESFTQRPFKNCFGCHDTQAIVSDLPHQPNPLVEEKKINVSHVMSKFLAEKPDVGTTPNPN